MNQTSWMMAAGGILIGVLLGWGVSSLTQNMNTAGGSGTADERHQVIRLERDNESLRTALLQAEEKLERSQSLLAAAETEEVPEEEAQVEEKLPETPVEIGRYFGSLRKEWDEFASLYPNGAPDRDDPAYQEFINGYREIASKATVLGMKMGEIASLPPKDYAQFQTSMVTEYLGMEESSVTQYQQTMEQISEQLAENQLGWSDRPEEPAEMREWFEKRREFEEASSQYLLDAIPADHQESYAATFGERPLSGGMRDMMRGMRTILRPSSANQ